MNDEFPFYLKEKPWFEGNKSWDNKKINWLKFIWNIITNKNGFRWRLEGTIQYALRHHDYHRGYGSGEVMLAVHSLDKVFEEIK